MIPADVILLIFLAALGACVGSFLNVLIYRLPEGKNIVHPPSACPGCGTRIRWYDNVPVLSWLLLRGRCRQCGQPISAQYPIVEALTAGLFVGWFVVAYHTDLRPDFAGPGFVNTWPVFAVYLVLFAGLLAATVIDARYLVIPLTVMWFVTAVALVVYPLYGGWFVDRPHAWLGGLGMDAPAPWPAAAWVGAALGGAAGLAGSIILVQAGLLPRSFDVAPVEPADDEAPDAFLEHPHPRREVLKECLFLVLPVAGAVVVSALLDGRDMPAWVRVLGGVLLGYLAGGAVVWATRVLGTLGFGREAMGLGDVHLLAAVGAVAGWPAAVLTFFVAPFLGLGWALLSAGAQQVLKREVRIIPYGPHLAAAAVGVIAFERPLMTFIATLINADPGY